MKILKFFLLAFTLVAFVSCSSDDDSSGDDVMVVELTNANLAGTYAITFYAGSSVTTVTATDGSSVVTERENYSGDTFTDAIFVFNENGTFSASGSYRENSTLMVTGQAPQSDSVIVNIDLSGSYSLNNATRTITIDGQTFDVNTFNGTNLKVTGTVIETSGNTTVEDSFEYRFVKLL